MRHSRGRYEARGFSRPLRPRQDGRHSVRLPQGRGAVAELDVGVHADSLVVAFDSGEERGGGARGVGDLAVDGVRLEEADVGEVVEDEPRRLPALVDSSRRHGVRTHTVAHEQKHIACSPLDVFHAQRIHQGLASL